MTWATQEGQADGVPDGEPDDRARPPVIYPPSLYQVQRNQQLNVSAAAGLLAASYSPDRAPLTVQLVGTAPAGLRLLPNGSFTYTPRPNFIGAVSFQFQVNDGLFLSRPFTVKIKVSLGGRGRG